MKKEHNDGDTTCDTCNKDGNFNDGTMYGTKINEENVVLCEGCLISAMLISK